MDDDNDGFAGAMMEEVDLTNASRPLLLVKVPGFLAEAWSYAKDGELVAELTDGSLTLCDSSPYFAVAKQAIDLKNQSVADAAAKKEQLQQLQQQQQQQHNQQHTQQTSSSSSSNVSSSSSSSSSASSVRRVPSQSVAPVALKPTRKTSSSALTALRRQQSLPRAFVLTSSEDKTNLTHIFTEGREEGISWDGIVRHRLDLRPDIRSSEYSGLLRMRTAVAETKTRSIIRVDEDESRTSLETIFPGGSKPETVRRERGAAEVVAAGLLRLFEQKEYWSIKELANELKQPPAAVKEQVAKYCVQNRKGGPNRQLYELRPDLKQAKATAADLGDE